MGIGKLLICIGLGLFLLGLIINFAPWLFDWFGKLPGDIRISNERRSFFMPFTSMLVVSIILSIILSLFFRQ